MIGGSSRRLVSKQAFYDRLQKELGAIRKAGLYKDEQVLASPQASEVLVQGGGRGAAAVSMINFCANNYLGLSNHPGKQWAEQSAGGASHSPPP